MQRVGNESGSFISISEGIVVVMGRDEQNSTKKAFLTPEVGHRGFIYATFGLGASYPGLWAYGLGQDKKPAWRAGVSLLTSTGPSEGT